MEANEILAEAIRHLELATRLSPRNPRYNALLGEAYLLGDEAESALVPLQVSYQEESHPRTAYLLGLTLLKTSRFRDAERYATVALEEGDAFHRAYHVRSRARLALGDQNSAIEDLWQALDLAPGDETYRLELGRLLLERAFAAPAEDRGRRLIEARDVLLLREAPRSLRAEWCYLVGCCLIELRQPAEALQYLDRTEFPSPPELAFRRGLCLAHLGNYDKAREEMQVARREPELATAADRYLELFRAKLGEAIGSESGPGPALTSSLFGELELGGRTERLDPLATLPVGLYRERTTAPGMAESLSDLPADRDETPRQAQPRVPPTSPEARERLRPEDDDDVTEELKPKPTESLPLLADLTEASATAIDPFEEDEKESGR